MLNFHIFLQNNFCLLLRDFYVVVVVVESDCLFVTVNVLLETKNQDGNEDMKLTDICDETPYTILTWDILAHLDTKSRLADP